MNREIREMLAWFKKNKRLLIRTIQPTPKPSRSIGGGTTQKSYFVQAPATGVPPRVGLTPGSATCDAVIESPDSGVGYSTGDFVLNGESYTIKNWTFDRLGDDGDRVIKVDGHYNGAYLDGASCTNVADPNSLVERPAGGGGGS